MSALLEMGKPELGRELQDSDLVMVHSFPKEPKGASDARHWVDDAFTQIVADTTDKKVASLVRRVLRRRRDDIASFGGEVFQNSVRHDSLPTTPAEEVTDLDALEKMFLGGEPAIEASSHFVAGVAVDTRHREVIVFAGDGSQMPKGSLSSKPVSPDAETGRGGRVMFETADRVDVLTDTGLGRIKDEVRREQGSSVLLEKAVAGGFSGRRLQLAPVGRVLRNFRNVTALKPHLPHAA